VDPGVFWCGVVVSDAAWVLSGVACWPVGSGQEYHGAQVDQAGVHWLSELTGNEA